VPLSQLQRVLVSSGGRKMGSGCMGNHGEGDVREANAVWLLDLSLAESAAPFPDRTTAAVRREMSRLRGLPLRDEARDGSRCARDLRRQEQFGWGG
jgi:hypothetical protein